MNEIDILTTAGLARTTAEMVVALHTLATTIGELATQPQAEPPQTAPSEGGDADGRDE